ncbi:hypothetical protein BH10PSE10_BH10PSE10_00350 [soil metagenome]
MRVCLTLQKLFCAFALLIVHAAASHAAAMERGAAITDPELLRMLEQAGLGLAQLLDANSGNSSADLFALPSMTVVRDATDRDFSRYVVNHKNAPDNLILFDRDALNASGTRFDLAGIVNRMDRAYVSPEECGEIRLIYRPVANHDSTSKAAPPLRLPMTFNLVMKAKPANATVACTELAKRWLALSNAAPAGSTLEWITRKSIDRIELNIQVARKAADANDFDGRADYLMKVFRLDLRTRRFEESPLENQIDVERIRADPKLASEFRQWLLEPARLTDLDRGTIVLPDRFLATSVINETPPRVNTDANARELFSDDDVVTALAKVSAAMPLQNILSPAGFARRLNDITCSGCHQTRAVGGFHFPGREKSGPVPDSAVVAAASPHFFGDQERRRDILAAFRDGRLPDFSRGFSARPQQRRATELAGTTYVNGWGAVCYPASANTAPDKSFSSWGCAEGLSCQATPGAKVTRTGFCFLKSE